MQLQQRRIILQIQLMMSLVALSLRLFGLKRTWRLLDKLTFSPNPPRHAQPFVEQTLAALKQTLAHTCSLKKANTP